MHKTAWTENRKGLNTNLSCFGMARLITCPISQETPIIEVLSEA